MDLALFMSCFLSPFRKVSQLVTSPGRQEEDHVLPVFACGGSSQTSGYGITWKLFIHHRSLGLSQFLLLCYEWDLSRALLISFWVLLLKKFRNWCFSLRYFWDLTAGDSALVDLLCFCQSDVMLRCTAGDSALTDLLCFHWSDSVLLCFCITVCKMEYALWGLTMLRLTWIVLWIWNHLLWSIIFQTWKIPQRSYGEDSPQKLKIENFLYRKLQNCSLFSIGLFLGGSGSAFVVVISVPLKS